MRRTISFRCHFAGVAMVIQMWEMTAGPSISARVRVSPGWMAFFQLPSSFAPVRSWLETRQIQPGLGERRQRESENDARQGGLSELHREPSWETGDII
jgi:hypothetical protein